MDELLGLEPDGDFTCLDFVIMVYNHILGVIPSSLLELKSKGVIDTGTLRRQYTRVSSPSWGSLVVMKRLGLTHLGVHADGKVLHLHERGSSWHPLQTLKMAFTTVHYYDYIEHH